MPALIRQARRLLDQGQAAVLITVAQTKGSAPRNAGTRMLVSSTQQWQTIGGGHLEWQAIHQARTLMNDHVAGKSARLIERYPLGPRLGQCCGGMVTLVFELLGSDDLEWLEDLATLLDTGKSAQRRVGMGAQHDVSLMELPHSLGHTRLDQDLDGHTQWFTDELSPPAIPVVLFGAGHIGKALVHFLGSLSDCSVTWVDEREAEFPDSIPSNVQVHITDFPEEAVELAPANAYFLVMTHRHDLDQKLCNHILKRNDFRYAGLIGSQTKRQQFEKRFRQRGITDEVIERLTCPIGIGQIRSKEPAAIAVAITAQLLQLHESFL